MIADQPRPALDRDAVDALALARWAAMRCQSDDWSRVMPSSLRVGSSNFVDVVDEVDRSVRRPCAVGCSLSISPARRFVRKTTSAHRF